MDATHEPSIRFFWYSIALAVVFNGLFLGWLLFKPETQELFVLGDDIGQALGWLLATLLCFVGLKRSWQSLSSVSTSPSRPHTLQRWTPILFAAGIFCQLIGQVIYTYYDAHHWAPFPSWADVGYLSTFPFLLSGILLLPLRPLSGITRSRVLLDSFMIMTALVTFSWYFVLGPTMLQGNETGIAKITGSAYPFFDLVLIFCVLRISFGTNISAPRSVVLLLSLGLIIVVITDSIYDYQTLQSTYVNGLQDVGWPIGYMLIGLAAQALNVIHIRPNSVRAISKKQKHMVNSSPTIASEWTSLLPYAFIPAVIALIIYTWRTGTNPTLVNGVYLGGFILLGLVLMRQFFAIRETIFYNKELRRMQQELYKKNEALSRANKQLEEQTVQVAASYEQQRNLNELKDQFLLNVNHELRTPLTELRGYLELLQDHVGDLDSSVQTNFITFALHGCEELQRLVSTILDAIRWSYQEKPLSIEVFPILDVAHEVLALFEPRKWEDYSLELDIPETIIVNTDRGYLHRILLNLLSNAFKYSPKGTTITISAHHLATLPNALETANIEQAPTPMTKEALASILFDTTQRVATAESQTDQRRAYALLISVKDTGPGIPPLEIPLLFEKFVRLKRDLAGSVRGTGLGLYICKQLVEALGGRIWVESSGIDGEGSNFCFVIPQALEPLTNTPDSIISEADLAPSQLLLP